MQVSFSFIVPVFNRPNEVDELLMSLTHQNFEKPFEVVIVEDGSSISSQHIVEKYNSQLDITYLSKRNSGPGDSRNYGMRRATGNYFIILDSDCILPPQYLTEVEKELNQDFVACFGGPDAAHESFSNLQKAINFSMTSFITTGGIRGNKIQVDKFQPRSFNMGISKEAFQKTNGFGNIHPGEDPDLSIRLWKLGYRTKLFTNAFVYHKRRMSWRKFYNQVRKFGMVRPILNEWHPETKKLTYWFPSLFITGFLLAILVLAFGIQWPLFFYGVYLLLVFISALIATKSAYIALLSIVATCIQFYGYGLGFLKSFLAVSLLKKSPEAYFTELFFKQND